MSGSEINDNNIDILVVQEIQPEDKDLILSELNKLNISTAVQINTLDILTLKSDNPTVTENDFIPVNYSFKNESIHSI